MSPVGWIVAATDPAAIERLVSCADNPAPASPALHVSLLLLYLAAGLLAWSLTAWIRALTRGHLGVAVRNPGRTATAGAILLVASALPPAGWHWLLLVPLAVTAHFVFTAEARRRLLRDPWIWTTLLLAALLAW